MTLTIHVHVCLGQVYSTFINSHTHTHTHTLTLYSHYCLRAYVFYTNYCDQFIYEQFDLFTMKFLQLFIFLLFSFCFCGKTSMAINYCRSQLFRKNQYIDYSDVAPKNGTPWQTIGYKSGPSNNDVLPLFAWNPCHGISFCNNASLCMNNYYRICDLSTMYVNTYNQVENDLTMPCSSNYARATIHLICDPQSNNDTFEYVNFIYPTYIFNFTSKYNCPLKMTWSGWDLTEVLLLSAGLFIFIFGLLFILLHFVLSKKNSNNVYFWTSCLCCCDKQKSSNGPAAGGASAAAAYQQME